MRESVTLNGKEQQRTEVVGRWLAGILTTGEATQLLGCSERTAWRLRAAMLREGAAGLAHGNRGRPSARRLSAELADRIVELGITSILAGSAQAKGRIERAWGTFQDRLASELRRRGVIDLDGANEVLADFVPRFNRRFAVPAASAVPAWRPLPPGLDLAHVLAFRWRRAVGSDSTVRLEGALLQLPAGAGGRSLAGRRVEVELRLDGRLLVLADGRLLAAVPAPPEPRRLREVRLLDPKGPPVAAGEERPGYRPRSDHPWNRPGPKAPSRLALTDSLSR